jgi:transcriptional regulator with XRE-family HTH domain
MIDFSSFPPELKKARLELGLTQKALAERLGTTQSVVAALETGYRRLSFGMLSRLADILGEHFRPHINFE